MNQRETWVGGARQDTGGIAPRPILPSAHDESHSPYVDGEIVGLELRSLLTRHDARGWLVELFRHDELDSQRWPKMTYASMTLPGVTRGPHEHADQTDGFAFFGPSDFRVWAWDTRPYSPTYHCRWTRVIGQSNPSALWIPPGVVHAYRNVGDGPGLVFNAPNRLYGGWGKAFPVDETRHDVADPAAFPMD
jgi:dTDP-4-dehydrorhamnose 3,5-epimerase